MSAIEQQGNPDQPVTLEQQLSPEEIEKAAALSLVVQNAETAETWITNRQWNERWNETDVLYDAPRTYSVYEQTTAPKPNVTRFLLAQHVNSIHPQVMSGLFYEDPCFAFKQRPGTSADVARARSTMIQYQLNDMEFKNEVSLGMFQDILHGTTIFKWGMETKEVPDFQYTRKASPLKQKDALGQEISVNTEESDSFDEDIKYKTVWSPFFENREIRDVLVDPTLRLPDIRKAKWVIDKFYLSLEDLLELKKDPSYDLPDEDTIKSWFEEPKEQPALLGTTLEVNTNAPGLISQGEPDWKDLSADNYHKGLLALEYWDKNKTITVLNRKIVIRNTKNIFGKIPFYSCNWYNRIRTFWGLGVGRLIGQEQRLNQGLVNAGLAILNLLLDPPFVVNGDENVPSQNVRLRAGGIIKVKGPVRDAIGPLEMPKLPMELFTFLQNSQSAAEAVDGANDLMVQGNMPGPGLGGKSSITRTGTGVNALSGATASRLQGPLDRFIDQVLIPWIYDLDELNRRFLPMQQMRDVLGDELGEDFKIDEQEFLKGRVEFDVLAGSQLAARKILAQSLPLITQIFEQPQIHEQLAQANGEYVDVKELLLMWLEASGWPNRRDLIKKLTPEMLARLQNNNPAAAKTQGQAALENQKFEHARELQQQKGEIGVARDMLNKSLDQGGTALLRQAYEASPETLGQ